MYAFIHIPKTAGTTLRYLFRRSFGARHCDVKCPTYCRSTTPWLKNENLRFMNKLYPDLSGITGHRVCSFSDLDNHYPNIRYFTFLRDPSKRFLSKFHHLYRGRMEQCTLAAFEEFAKDQTQHNAQTKWLCGEQNSQLAIDMLENKIGLVGITEQFDQSLILLKYWLNEPCFDINYKSRNLSHGVAPLPYESDPYLKDLILQANKLDIEVYNYAVAYIFPKQIAAYGDNFDEVYKIFLLKQESFIDLHESLWARVKRDWIYKPSLHLPW
ncbi:MAG: sulfotransferase family 2 domain-containing protein [Colwellia sp.]